MIPPISNIYLETSAVNYLADKYIFLDAIATKIHHGLKGSRFYVSPVTIWEILLTENVERREQLIFYVQNLEYRELLNSPSEFIINYILAGCPKNEKKYSIHSKLPLSSTWSDICDNTSRTFVFEKNELLERTRKIRKGFNQASRFIENVGVAETGNNSTIAARLGLEGMLKRLKNINYEQISSRDRKKFKISLLLILIVLCYGVDFDNSFVEKYLSIIGIYSSQERFEYLFTKYEQLIYSGPFAVLSEIVLIQLEKGGKPTRGIFWDALHSIYVIYTNIFLTADEHFKKIRDNNDHPIYKRIVFLPEANLFTAKEIDITNISPRAF